VAVGEQHPSRGGKFYGTGFTAFRGYHQTGRTAGSESMNRRLINKYLQYFANLLTYK
jgi:hypothetical protein